MRVTDNDNEQALRQIDDLGRRLAVLEDATIELRSRDTRHRAVLETSPDAIIIINRDGNVIEFNPAAEQMFGYTREEARGRDLAELIVPPALRSAHRAGLTRYLQTGAPHMIGQRVEISAQRSDGSEFLVELAIQAVDADGEISFIGYVRDISEGARALEHLRLLADAGVILTESLDYEHTLESVARLVVPRFSDWCVVDLPNENGDLRRLAAAHADPELEPVLRAMIDGFPPDMSSSHPAVLVFRSGQSSLQPSISDEFLQTIARTPTHLDMLRQLRPGSSLIVPLVAHGKVRGVIEFLRSRSGWTFDDVDRTLGEELARRAAIAVENAALHRETARSLNESEENHALLETVLQSAPVGFAFLDRDLRYLRVNDTLATMNNRSADDHIGRTLSDVLPDIYPEVESRMRQVIETGDPIVNVDVTRSVPGCTNTSHALASYYPVRTDDGTLIGVSAVLVDITARRADEDRSRFLADASRLLAESLDYSETLAQVARLAVPTLADWCIVYILEPDGTIERLAVEHANPAHAAIREAMQREHRIDPDAGSGVPEVIRSGVSILRNDATPEVLAQDNHKPQELQALVEPLAVHAWMCVPMTVRGRTIGAMSFLATESDRWYDDTDLALAEEIGHRAATAVDNARLYTEAQDAIRQREQFLSIASHELKTPLTSVKAAGQLIERWARDPVSHQDRLTRVSHQLTGEVTRLETLVSDLLDASRVHQGRLELRIAPVDLAALAAEVVQRYEHAPERLETHQLVVDAPEATVGDWDAARLDQVITNLVSNALKYSPSGGTVRVDVRKGISEALLRVSDEGIGVPPEERGRLFRPFSRSASVRESIGGTGLGLFISAQIVELHGGTIGVTSRAGGGSAFTVTLPLNALPKNTQPEAG